MSEGIDSNEDIFMPYWKAVISTLPPAKRDAAWEFYLKRIGSSSACDTLSGLILLLEANGIFMQALPLEFQAELIQPMIETASGMKCELQQFAADQRKSCESTQRNLETINQLGQAITLCGSEVRQKVQMAVQDISTERIGTAISASLETSTLRPLKDALQIVNERSLELTNCGKAAQQSVELWRKVHVGGMFLWALAVATVACVIVCGLVHGKIREHYEKRLEEFTNAASKTALFAQKLQQYGITLNVKPALDSNGAELPGTYAVYVPNTDEFQVLTDGKFRTAVVLVKPGIHTVESR